MEEGGIKTNTSPQICCRTTPRKVNVQVNSFRFISLCHVGVVYYVCLLCLFAPTTMWWIKMNILAGIIERFQIGVVSSWSRCTTSPEKSSHVACIHRNQQHYVCCENSLHLHVRRFVSWVFTARRYAQARSLLWPGVCPSVCPSIRLSVC